MPMHPVALVTGSGSRRIGRAVADALAARGYALIVHYRTSATEAAEAVAEFTARGVQAIAVQADLTDEAAVRHLVAQAFARFGRLDVLVTAAALWGRKRLEEVTAADVRCQFDANVLGTFLCCQHAGLAMVKQPEGGAIVTIADWAIERPYLDYAAYFPSKGAIPTLTRTFAVELGTRQPKGARELCLAGPGAAAPGLTRTGKAASDRGNAGKAGRQPIQCGPGRPSLYR